MEFLFLLDGFLSHELLRDTFFPSSRFAAALIHGRLGIPPAPFSHDHLDCARERKRMNFLTLFTHLLTSRWHQTRVEF
jgi:hypothetical protein